MRTSTIIATLSAPPETVWDVVTNLQDTEWRSDLSRVEVSLDGRHFTEFSANGHSTSFSILEKTPYERYAFSMCSNIFPANGRGSFPKLPRGKPILSSQKPCKCGISAGRFSPIFFSP